MGELMRDPAAQDTLRFRLAGGKEVRGALAPPAR